MNSSNLALVFGPTLVQAPTHLEALQLHNDVPAINVLIQVCIEQHDVIFPVTATPPPPPVIDEPHSQSVSPSPQVAISEVSIVVWSFHVYVCTCVCVCALHACMGVCGHVHPCMCVCHNVKLKLTVGFV